MGSSGARHGTQMGRRGPSPFAQAGGAEPRDGAERGEEDRKEDAQLQRVEVLEDVLSRVRIRERARG